MASKNEYFYRGPKDPFENTEAISMADGRYATVGEKIELTDAEAELLRQTSNLRAVNESNGERETASQEGKESGKVNKDSE